jgi:glycerol-3-phosphate cytidylyltransferase
METSLLWFVLENPEQIYKLYSIINHKSLTEFLLFHNGTILSSEILSFLDDNDINSKLYHDIEKALNDEFPCITFFKNNINTIILLYYISRNNISKIIVDIDENDTGHDVYDIVSKCKDVHFFYPNLIIEIYTSEKTDEEYNDEIFSNVSSIFCRNIMTYNYFVTTKSLQSSYKKFPKLFYVKFSEMHDGQDYPRKFLKNKYNRGITFGTFDLFHFGHDNILKRCRNFCDYLCVGLSSDELNERKGKTSIDDYEKRKNMIRCMQYGDEIFKEESLELKNEYVIETGAEILMMGDDWVGAFDWVSCHVVYMERTPNISTTILKAQLNKDNT